MKECERVVDKVNSILKSLNIHVSRYDFELDDLKYIISNFGDSLKQSRLSNSNLTDQLNRAKFISKERRLK